MLSNKLLSEIIVNRYFHGILGSTLSVRKAVESISIRSVVNMFVVLLNYVGSKECETRVLCPFREDSCRNKGRKETKNENRKGELGSAYSQAELYGQIDCHLVVADGNTGGASITEFKKMVCIVMVLCPETTIGLHAQRLSSEHAKKSF
jgi:hypothetical protein